MRIWCWFDIIILANVGATDPLVKDGHALVWRSDDIPITANEAADEQVEKLFGSGHEILGLLTYLSVKFLLFCVCVWFVLKRSFFQDGSAVSVRACAYFPGWELYVHSARLVVRISNDSEGTHFILLLGIHA